jgi:hypothetical protein
VYDVATTAWHLLAMADDAHPVFTWGATIAEDPGIAPPTLFHGPDAPSCSTAEWLLIPSSTTSSHGHSKSLNPHADYGEYVLRLKGPNVHIDNTSSPVSTKVVVDSVNRCVCRMLDS